MRSLKKFSVARCPFLRNFVGALVAMLVSTANLAAPAGNSLIETGRKLADEAKCEACHIGKVGGDGSQIYLRKDRRVTVKSKLVPQIARCNNELNLGLFPDDEAAIGEYLNAKHYQFKD